MKTLVWTLCFVLNFVIIFKQKFEKVLPFSFIVAIVIMFICGLFNNVKLGYYFLYAIDIVSIVYIINSIVKKDKESLTTVIKNYFTIGLFVFVVLFVGISIYFRYGYFETWDEFSHWGPMVKNMYKDNVLFCDSSLPCSHKDYPPFVSLFELLWCYISGSFHEKFIYRALCILTISLFMPLISLISVKKNSIKKYVFLLCSVIVIVGHLMFNLDGLQSMLSSIYLDSFLSIIAATVFVFVATKDYFSVFDIHLLTALMSLLLMTKQMSIAFFVMNVFLLVIKVIIWKIPIKKKMSILLPVILIPILFYFVHQIKIAPLNLSKQFDISQMSLSTFINILKGNGLDYQNEVLRMFPDTLKYLALFGKLTYFSINFIITICISISLFLLSKKKFSEKILIIVTYILGAIGYALLMLFLYCFGFSIQEATNLASFSRYMNIYVYFGITVAIGVIMVMAISDENETKGLIITTSLALLVGYNGYSNRNMYHTYTQEYGYSVDYNMQNLVEQINKYVKDGEKILIVNYDIYQGWHIMLTLDYENPGGYGYEFFYVTNDNNVKMEASEWIDLYLNYDYVYLFFTDDNFLNKLWKPSQNNDLCINGRMYKVVDGKLELLDW